MRIFGASCQFEGLYAFISSDAEQKMTNLKLYLEYLCKFKRFQQKLSNIVDHVNVWLSDDETNLPAKQKWVRKI